MDLQIYKQYLNPTVEIYNKKTQEYLVNELVERSLITNLIHDDIKDKDIKEIKKDIKLYDNILIGSIDTANARKSFTNRNS